MGRRHRAAASDDQGSVGAEDRGADRHGTGEVIRELILGDERTQGGEVAIGAEEGPVGRRSEDHAEQVG